MDSMYHSGERKMQREAGAMEAATNMGRTVLPVISHVYVDFIHSRPFLVLGAADIQGHAWGSLVSGSPGFMKVIDEQTLGIGVLPDDHDPLCGSLKDGSDVGLLLLDFATRRRLRLNGSVVRGQGGFSVRIRQMEVKMNTNELVRRIDDSMEMGEKIIADKRADDSGGQEASERVRSFCHE